MAAVGLSQPKKWKVRAFGPRWRLCIKTLRIILLCRAEMNLFMIKLL